jgi:hypothetical protein
VERVYRRDGAGDVAKLGAARRDRSGDHLEGALIGPLAHLAGVFLAEAVEPDRVLGQGEADRRAQDIGPLGVAERLEFAPALAVEELDLLGRLAPALCRPQDVGAQPDRFAGLDIGSHLERKIVTAQLRERARLKQQALVAQLVREIGRACRPQGGERPLGLAVHQVDDREPRRHLRARGALQPVVDLMLQQLGRLVEPRSTATSRSASRRIISSPRRPIGVSSR